MTSPVLVPVIDLCLLSHSEITDLANIDPHAYDLNCLSIIVPKIDRSIFNKSANSHKQTYSHIRKPAPVPHPSPPTTAIARTNSSSSSSSTSLNSISTFIHRTPIQSFHPPIGDLPPIEPKPHTILAALPPPPPTCRTAAAAVTVVETLRALVVVEENKDKELLNAKEEVVDVAGLGTREEQFVDELRRTEGMKMEEELLRFLASLDGKLGSSRKKQKFADAGRFGDVFPRRREGAAGTEKEEWGAIVVLPEIYQVFGGLPLRDFGSTCS